MSSEFRHVIKIWTFHKIFDILSLTYLHNRSFGNYNEDPLPEEEPEEAPKPPRKSKKALAKEK